METEKMLPVPIEQPEIEISPELSALLADFDLPEYEPHIYLKKRTKDFKHYDSEAECRHCMKNHVDSVYNEAAKYLDITSIYCIGRTVPDYYRNGWKVPEVLEKDVNDLARTLYNFAYNEYLNKVARPAAEILNKVEFIPETTDMEEIV